MRRLEIKLVEGTERGVFTTKHINGNGEIIEVAPLIVIPKSEIELIELTRLSQYYFLMKSGSIAIALGYGSLYNHSSDPNAEFKEVEGSMVFSSLKGILRGEEITIDYTGGDRGMELGFTPRF
jgi:uncharacterized protein